jgi:hypothetical protein
MDASAIEGIVSLVVAGGSFCYAVWSDRIKYRGKPAVYVGRNSESGWEITFQNNNGYAIQIRDVRVPSGVGRDNSISVATRIYGRHNFPVMLQPGASAVIFVPREAILGRESVIADIATGRVGMRGQSRLVSFKVALKESRVSGSENGE